MEVIPIDELRREQGFVSDAVLDFYNRKINFDDLYLMFENATVITNDSFYVENNDKIELICESTVMFFHQLFDIPYLSIQTFVMICTDFDIKLSFSEYALALMQIRFPI